MLAVRTPGAPQATRSVARPAIPPSPLRDRVGYSDHVRFRGYFPVHFIPAYNLPVYASRWPLPDTTQDSVRGCSLGFTAAAISGDGDQRTCKAQLSQNRICGPRVRLFGSLAQNAKTSCSESSTGFRPCRRRLLPWSCASLCAAGRRARRMRPTRPPPRPHPGCRRTRSSIDW